MKAITLTQPYATLVASGAKRIETRSWATRYRGPLAIHAGAGLGPVGGRRGLHHLCVSSPFCTVLPSAGYHPMRGATWGLPTGAIVAVVEVVDVCQIEEGRRPWYRRAAEWECRPEIVSDQECAFGDYNPGRYAWLLADVRALAEPIPARGQLGLWTVPAETEAQIGAQLEVSR